MKSNSALKLNPEEIAEISKLLAETVIQQLIQHPEIYEIPVKEIEIPKEMPIIPEEEITQVIDLELIATGTFGITDPLGQLRDWFVSTISGISDFIISSVQTWINENVIPFFDSLYNNVSSWINRNVIPAISGVVSSISDFITENVLPAFENLFTNISSWITEYVLPAITGVSETISGFITNNVLPAIYALMTSISDMFSNATLSITQTLTGVIHGISVTIQSVISGAITSITSFANSISQSIMSAISGVANTVSSTFQSIISAMSGVIDTLSSIFNSIAQSIMSAIGGAINTVSSMISGIANSIINSISYIGQSLSGLWDFLVSSFQNMVGMVSAGFQTISKTFMGFTNAILQLPDFLAHQFKNIGEWIWNAVPDWLRTPIENIGKFFTETLMSAIASLAEGIQTFITDPFGWINSSIIKPIVEMSDQLYSQLVVVGQTIWSGLNWVWGKLVDVGKEVFNAMWKTLTGFGQWLWNSVVGFFQSVIPAIHNAILTAISTVSKTIMEGITNFVSGILNTAKDVASGIGKAITEVVLWVFEPVMTAFQQQYTTKITEFMSKVEKHSTTVEDLTYFFEALGGFISEVFLAHWAGFGISQLLHGLASYVDELRPIPQVLLEGEGGCALEPIGLGARLRSLLGWVLSLGWHLKPSYILREMAKDSRELTDTFTRGLIYGLTIWSTNPLTRMLNVAFRDLMVIELPPIPTMQEIVRRHLPRKDYGDVLNEYVKILKLYGYRTSIIDWLTSKDITMTIEDRFGKKRTIPLALVYNMPSSSDVARMMVRDIIINIEDFKKFLLATGIHENIASLYYLLHFRYPSPKTLWNFTVRGVSGLLWATISKDEEDAIKRDVEASGGFMPISPIKLNFKPNLLFNAFKTYMKWHDYARFSYIKNFTSDNLIYIDTLADIPTKIDQRWMVKWGLYELLSEKGVSYTSPIQHFVAKIVEDRPASEIKMDLTNFSRTLQATGMHPYWIPVTAVAEAMNALSEERTYLRTGVINLFKEGFISRDSLKSVFAGVFKVSFKVAYFDINDYTWKTGYVNLPVMYLPAERELLALRADMDRVLDILREIQRDISRAFQESIISSYDEYKANLVKVIENLQNITPEKVNLEFIEEYYKPYVEALKIYQQVYTIRRMRSWAMRWLGWIMYRVATGIVTENELTNLINTLVKYAKLTKIEEQFFADVMKVMRGIAVKEYIPTPSQIATLSEYLTIPEDLVKQSFDVKMIPKNWRAIWSKYIAIRPVSDDVKSLLTTYRRALLYTEIPAEMEKQVKELAKFIGFTDKEMSILQLRVALEELIQNRREYIPTPYSLATLVEYVPKAREFFNEVMKAKRVPERWQKIWAKYIDVRPLVSDVKKYLSRAENLYVRFMIQKEVFLKILNEVADYLGYTSKEIEFLMSATELERARNAWTELIGTVERLVSLSEYSPTASKYALGKLYAMIDSLPIPPSEKQELKKMWEEYIKNKPVKSEAKTYITQLINLFVDGLISDSDFEKELQAMKEWGFSDHEIMFYKAQATLRKIRKLRIPISTAGG